MSSEATGPRGEGSRALAGRCSAGRRSKHKRRLLLTCVARVSLLCLERMWGLLGLFPPSFIVNDCPWKAGKQDVVTCTGSIPDPTLAGSCPELASTSGHRLRVRGGGGPALLPGPAPRLQGTNSQHTGRPPLHLSRRGREVCGLEGTFPRCRCVFRARGHRRIFAPMLAS